MKRYFALLTILTGLMCATEVQQKPALEENLQKETFGQKVDKALGVVKETSKKVASNTQEFGKKVIKETKKTANTVANASKKAFAKTGEFVGNATQKVAKETKNLGKKITKNSKELEKANKEETMQS